jgi:hypothetical protein
MKGTRLPPHLLKLLLDWGPQVSSAYGYFLMVMAPVERFLIWW